MLIAEIPRMFRPRRPKFASVVFLLATVAFVSVIVFVVDWLISSPQPLLADVDIQVVIIEEHHEALEYWYNAANDGLLPKKNNMLVHIDAHSDDASPEFVAGMPFFRYPKTDAEMRDFMQKNDVFIQGAVMSGLVSRFVWIWPTWDEEKSSTSMPYELHTVELGTFRVDTPNTTVDFCVCESEGGADRSGKASRHCEYNNATTDEETTMSPERCITKTAYTAEYVSADHVLDKMTASPDWLAADDVEGVIIDVDEDFFGCESPSDQLGDGDTWWQVEAINEYLSKFLCPRTVDEESAADRLARRLFRFMLDVCRRHRYNRCRPPTLLAIVISAFVGRPSMFCRFTASHVKKSWVYLAEILAQVPVTLLKRILDIGFCLNEAPRSHDFGRLPYFGAFIVCTGANEPNSTFIYRHTPSLDELDAQMRSFDRLVAELLRQAATLTHRVGRGHLLVTVCRSVRDGYTPRTLAARIEDGILSSLRRQRRSGTMTVVYDKDLLHGSGGWNSRP